MIISFLKHHQRDSSSVFYQGHHTCQTLKIQCPCRYLFFILPKQIFNHEHASSFEKQGVFNALLKYLPFSWHYQKKEASMVAKTKQIILQWRKQPQRLICLMIKTEKFCAAEEVETSEKSLWCCPLEMETWPEIASLLYLFPQPTQWLCIRHKPVHSWVELVHIPYSDYRHLYPVAHYVFSFRLVIIGTSN